MTALYVSGGGKEFYKYALCAALYWSLGGISEQHLQLYLIQ